MRWVQRESAKSWMITSWTSLYRGSSSDRLESDTLISSMQQSAFQCRCSISHIYIAKGRSPYNRFTLLSRSMNMSSYVARESTKQRDWERRNPEVGQAARLLCVHESSQLKANC